MAFEFDPADCVARPIRRQPNASPRYVSAGGVDREERRDDNVRRERQEGPWSTAAGEGVEVSDFLLEARRRLEARFLGSGGGDDGRIEMGSTRPTRGRNEGGEEEFYYADNQI
jgi:hypothetical protein